MELVRGDQTEKRSKQIQAINSANPLSRFMLIGELMVEKWKDYQLQRKGIELIGNRPGEDNNDIIKKRKSAEFGTLIIAQGYMLGLILIDIAMNLIIPILLVSIAWGLIAIYLPSEKAILVDNNALIGWVSQVNDEVTKSVQPVSVMLEPIFQNIVIQGKTMGGLANIVPSIIMALGITIVNKMLAHLMKNNIIEMLM